jgi:septal ring factor EnvC (AmiA/AmiB activator)
MRRTMSRPLTTATSLHTSRRCAGLVALVALALVLVGGDGLASAQSARDERKKVQAEQQAAESEVDALQANQQQINARLAEIDAAVRASEAAAAEATRAAQVSAAEADAARAAAAASEAELAGVRDRLRALAVSAYVNPPGEELMRRFEASSAQRDATRQALLAMRSGRDVDLADQVRVIQRRHEDDLERAEASRLASEEAAAAAAASAAALQASRGEQEAFATSVRARLDARLADVAALERIDAGLAERIRAEEAAVAAALRALAPRPAASAAADTSGPARPAPPPPPLRTAGGITVNAQIADQLTAMIQAAAADGIVLSGSGYRNINAQIQLRRQHCGTTDYAVYEMPPDECSPPTARPSMSLHEQGLAVDLTANGRSIVSRTDPGYVWLAANGARFGFINLPSEPWHWSVTGG